MNLPASSSAPEVRTRWAGWCHKLAMPLLDALADSQLKARMPVEQHPHAKDRPDVTHLEAMARLLAGLAPWLELGDDGTAEGKIRGTLANKARLGITAATDPASPDFMNFVRGGQPLVDAAFLAQALLRAPTELWEKLDSIAQTRVVAALKATRAIIPGESNWKLFATLVEVFLHRVGEVRDDSRLFEGVRKHRDWYLGDGTYGDGPEFHWDYYNAFVIQPMLLETLEAVGDEAAEWSILREKVRGRFTRQAEIQERLIAPDGSFPAIGRSIVYRCGAFQVLALAALRKMLPKTVSPAQARTALDRVIDRTLRAPETFDNQGWLRIGLAGAQPKLGEIYISTGSLYLCSMAFLPLGLPTTDPFWKAPEEATTWEKVWRGDDLPADTALKEA